MSKYKSPIELIIGNASIELENDIIKACSDYGIVINLEELKLALAYDRGQFTEGFMCAINQIKYKIAQDMKELHTQDYNGRATLQSLKDYLEELEREG